MTPGTALPALITEVLERVKSELDRLTRERDAVAAFYDQLISAAKPAPRDWAPTPLRPVPEPPQPADLPPLSPAIAPEKIGQQPAPEAPAAEFRHGPDTLAAPSPADQIAPARDIVEAVREALEPAPLEEDAVDAAVRLARENDLRKQASEAAQDSMPERKIKYTPNRSDQEMLTDIRDWVRLQGNKLFTSKDLAAGIGITSPSYAVAKMKPLMDQGTVVMVGQAPRRGKSTLYKFAGKPEPTNPPRPLAQPDIDPSKLPPLPSQVPVPGTGRNTNLTASMKKDIAELLEKVRNQITLGARPDGHIRITCKRTGNYHDISATPSDVNAIHSIRRDLKRIGVYVPDSK